MSTEYDLERAHPWFRDALRWGFDSLLDRFPWVIVKRVEVYPRREDDRSLGSTDSGIIRLNGFWFSRDPADLQYAALDRPVVTVAGRRLGWHSAMTIEPDHVIAHEFGHAATPSLPGWRDWAGSGWRAALLDPDPLTSGYGLGARDEHGAEEFALYALGLADGPRREAMEDLLRDHLR